MYSFEFDAEYTRQALLLCALLETMDEQLGEALSQSEGEGCFDPNNICGIKSHEAECIGADSSLYAEADDRKRFFHDTEAQGIYALTLEKALASGESFTDETSFKNLHAILFAGQEHAGEYATFANKIRMGYDEDVQVSYIAAAPEIKSQEIQALFEQYNHLVLENPRLHIAYACCLLLNCNLIHPFQDGNGRTARFLFMSELYRARLKHVTQIPLCQTFVPNLTLLYNSQHGWPNEYGQACYLPKSSILLLKLLVRCYRLALSKVKQGLVI